MQLGIQDIKWLATLTAVSYDLGLNPEKGIDVCKCIVPSQQGDTLNSCRAAKPLVRLVEGEERWKTPDHLQGILSQNWGGNEPKLTVTCISKIMVDFHKRILFSDEAFWLNGYVNKQNCRIWSEANPQVYVATPLHPEKLTVWCALWAGGILLQKR
ncbi:uncharacterized protein TNCV_948881 [Trichonephila clavipes]|nr:uncharacterized protein TNCV_948881 [Trichonephila clavipes]